MNREGARCHDCTWETYTDPYRAAQDHLEDQPHHHVDLFGRIDRDWS